MIAQVICCNDSVEYAIVDDEKLAKMRLEELAKEDYEKRYKNTGQFKDYKAYRESLYWHIHQVKAEVVLK